MPANGLALLDIATAGRPRSGATESGDQYVTISHSRGLLVAVADGLGHGHNAADAASAAIAILKTAPQDPVKQLIERCHAALHGTRGVVMSLASLDMRTQLMSWTAVGNVEGIVLRAGKSGSAAREYISMRGGIIGHRLPPLYCASIPISAGDLLIFATDGIRGGFEYSIDPHARLQDTANDILLHYGVATDDALVLVGQWSGNAGTDRVWT